jgi:hypothetical protein
VRGFFAQLTAGEHTDIEIVRTIQCSGRNSTLVLIANHVDIVHEKDDALVTVELTHAHPLGRQASPR